MNTQPHPEKYPVSVLIVTLNEAHNITECIESVSFAKEIIIFDSGSTDDTVNIAKKYTPLVFVTDWPGDGPQKLRAFEKSTQPWVLVLDADERVTPPLAEEIKKTSLLSPAKNTSPPAHGYIIPYQSYYFNHTIRFGDWRGENHLRLFHRDFGEITPDSVHCHIQIKGKTKYLKNKIIHHPFQSLEMLLHKLNVYSTKSAEAKYKKNKRANFCTVLLHTYWTFIRGYILKLGFLDGKAGLMLALSNTHGTYYRYLKLMQLSKNNRQPL